MVLNILQRFCGFYNFCYSSIKNTENFGVLQILLGPLWLYRVFGMLQDVDDLWDAHIILRNPIEDVGIL